MTGTDPVAEGICRISTFDPNYDTSFNQFVIVDALLLRRRAAAGFAGHNKPTYSVPSPLAELSAEA